MFNFLSLCYIMMQKLLERAKEEYSDAINLCGLILGGHIKCNAKELLQAYAILNEWVSNLTICEKNTKNVERKYGYRDMRELVENYISVFEENFKLHEEEILMWMNSLKEQELSEDIRNIIKVFSNAIEAKEIALIPDWRSWVPEV
ncbi:MAG: hypothetical protein IJV97_04395 [Alphaproteobacteria bacterium]|nr:hypothetical protein [Alphaproteobacteria bacterium]